LTLNFFLVLSAMIRARPRHPLSINPYIDLQSDLDLRNKAYYVLNRIRSFLKTMTAAVKAMAA
jgi:hypothetical protein